MKYPLCLLIIGEAEVSPTDYRVPASFAMRKAMTRRVYRFVEKNYKRDFCRIAATHPSER